MLFLKLINLKLNTRKVKNQHFILLSRFCTNEPWMPIKYLTPPEQKTIESKWREAVSNSPVINQDNFERSSQRKKYILSMFPYPSGNLHLGHVRVYTLSDAVSQIYRMKGWEVIHPMGWDAFGLPAENAAIERGENPEEWTQKNIKQMKSQLIDLGCRFEWSREVTTCNPDYYKWTQFIFLKLYKAGLAYKQKAMVNWDPIDKTVLANEQVDQDGCSWRSGAKVEKRPLSQWFIKTTSLSKELYDDLSDPCLENWKGIANIQREWIGDCNGYIIEMKLLDANQKQIAEMDHLSIWMAQPEYLENVEFLAIKSDHLLSKDVSNHHTINNSILLNTKAINPITKKLIPIIVNDHLNYEENGDIYVGISSLNDNDKKIVMDMKFDCLPLTPSEINSSKRKTIVDKLENLNSGGYESSVKLKDWLISRQRYWGTPIPIVYCGECGIVPVPDDDLPVELPKIKGSINKGADVLKEIKEWYYCCCPRCGKTARRETDTMDTFIDSSWYYLRYLDPTNSEKLIDKDKAQMSMPVDLYIGGKEHAALHLYYARFIHKFLTNIGIASHKEPFSQLLVQGMVKGRSFQVKSSGKYLHPDEVDFSVTPPVEKENRLPLLINFEKMSKSKHNGVAPQSLIDEYGVDAVRLAMLSSASPQSEKLWDSQEMKSSFEIMERLWIIARNFVLTRREEPCHLPELSKKEKEKYEIELFETRNNLVGEAIKAVDSKSNFHFHSLIKVVQRLVKCVAKVPKNLIYSDEYEKTFRCSLVMLSPICPYLTAELWQRINESCPPDDPKQNESIFKQPWPTVDPSYKILIIMIMKEKRPVTAKITLDRKCSTLTQEKALELAYENDRFLLLLGDGIISKTDFASHPHTFVLKVYTDIIGEGE